VLETLAENVRQNGGIVFFADHADAALDYCLAVARNHGVKLAVKGKSMVSEEIGLNTALVKAGIDVAETDLGEYIIQLAGERPSHIIAPAIHKTREDIGKLFTDKIMSTTMPKVHVAIMGMERVAARLEDHDILLRLLCRGAAAQNMGTYVSYIGGPRYFHQADGPDEFHLVILDNGRSRILADVEFREMLYCIRCAACLNVCPVYGKIGGHAYGHPYSGPVGAVVMPLLTGINRCRDLCQGETLC